ncbi:MAG: hypothetical protein WC827_03600 [Candidatus Paceibacterota bacterium]|jgi:hypothetical protein
MKAFKIGDRVTVKDKGYHYDTFTPKFKEMGFINPDELREDESKLKGYLFKVFAIGEHEKQGIPLYGIENSKGDQYLFSAKGLLLIKEDGTD